MNKLINGLNPAQILVVGFIMMILIGSILLAMPFSTETGEQISYIDALFTATSAVCVTGLAVVDTGSTFNLIGEIVLLVLIEIGGLGFMTFGVLFALLLGKRINLRQRILIQESIKHYSLQGVVKLAQLIFLITIGVQVAGTLLLSIRWIPEMGFGQGLYFSIFHSISAFNNAGFGLYPDSLMKYVSDPIVNITITLLLVIGGIGFSVIIDVFNKRSLKKLSLNTKMVLFTSLVLSVIGFVIFFILEIRNPLTLKPLDWDGRIWGAYFQSMVTRTAGFNSIQIGDMYSTSLFI
ncbi:MAG: potassium transporter TrkG, partial [Bacilli bacterium]